MIRADIEYTLRESGAVIARKNWWRHDKLPYQAFGLGRKYVHFNYPPMCSNEKVRYSDLTRKEWERRSGLKFHEEEK